MRLRLPREHKIAFMPVSAGHYHHIKTEKMFRYRPVYLKLAVPLFFTEVAIALFVHDSLIRPFIGDMLVVILIYCVIRSFFNFPALKTIIGVLLFAYLVEFSQYFHLVQMLGLSRSGMARIILGTTFSWMDIVMYTLAMSIVMLLESGNK